MLRFRRLRRFCSARLTLCSSRTVWLARVRKVVRLRGPARLSWRVLRAVPPKLTRLPGMLRGTRRHIRAVSTDHTGGIEGRRARGRGDTGMATVGMGETTRGICLRPAAHADAAGESAASVRFLRELAPAPWGPRAPPAPPLKLTRLTVTLLTTVSL